MSEQSGSDPLFPMPRTPVHFLVIEGWKPSGEIDLRFKCEAGPGERCRLRPADDREEWTYGDPDLVDSGKCWAHEWIEATGLEDGAIATISGEFGRVPVTISYAEGVEISPLPTEPTVLPTTHAILNQPGAINMCDSDNMQRHDSDSLGVIASIIHNARAEAHCSGCYSCEWEREWADTTGLFANNREWAMRVAADVIDALGRR